MKDSDMTHGLGAKKKFAVEYIEETLEKHPNILLSYDRYYDSTKEHELYFSVK